MNTSSIISHRMFVAALSGGRRAPASPPCPPAQVFVEPALPSAAILLEEQRRQEAIPALALRQVLSVGVGNGA